MVSDGVDKNLLITKKSIFNERSTNSGSFTEILHDCWDLVSSTYNLRFLNFFLFKIHVLNSQKSVIHIPTFISNIITEISID